jgi:hypothetical protein
LNNWPQGAFAGRTELVAEDGRIVMRAFIVACAVAGVIAVGAATVLDSLVQETAKVAFAEPSARN